MKKRSVISIIGSVIGYAVIAVLVAATIFVMFSKAAGRLVFIGNKSLLWVMTESMEPVIPERSYILVERIDAKDVRVGDVIVFISDDPAILGSYNTHRVAEIVGDNESFIMKGDNNLAEDKYPARAENVVAIYRRNLEFLSMLGRFLTSRIGLVSMIGLILALVMAMLMPEMRRMRDSQEVEAEKEHEAMIEALIAQEVEKLKKQEAEKAAENPAPENSEGK